MVRRIASFMLFITLLSPSALGSSQSAMMGEDILSICPTPSLPPSLPIGALFALSGAASVYGEAQQNAVLLAIDEINTSEFLGAGTTLDIIFEDSASDNTRAMNAMTKLVLQDRVLAVLGPTLSREALAANPIAQANNTIALGVSLTAEDITDLGEYVFRSSLPESIMIPAAVAAAAQRFSIQRVGVLFADDDAFTVSGYTAFTQALRQHGAQIIGEEAFATGTVDFSAPLSRLIAAAPDALAISALAAEGIQIITQARALGYRGPIIGGNGFNSLAVLERTGADADGLIVGAAWSSDGANQLSQSFIGAYQMAFGQQPDQFAVQAYTGAWLIAMAIRCANSADRAAVRDALAALENVNTPLGLFSFDDDRNPIHEPIVQTARGGVFVALPRS
ncbi:MAG: ABC transporter substrate-binding protein [Aggregatilineales bacterium]